MSKSDAVSKLGKFASKSPGAGAEKSSELRESVSKFGEIASELGKSAAPLVLKLGLKGLSTTAEVAGYGANLVGKVFGSGASASIQLSKAASSPLAVIESGGSSLVLGGVGLAGATAFRIGEEACSVVTSGSKWVRKGSKLLEEKVLKSTKTSSGEGNSVDKKTDSTLSEAITTTKLGVKTAIAGASLVKTALESEEASEAFSSVSLALKAKISGATNLVNGSFSKKSADKIISSRPDEDNIGIENPANELGYYNPVYDNSSDTELAGSSTHADSYNI